MNDRARFHGAKLMLFAGENILVLRRDDIEGIDWPGFLDFPGGGREGAESPEDCALRETREELGVHVSAELLEVAHIRRTAQGVSWFFAAHCAPEIARQVVLGDEGSEWLEMPPQGFIAAPDAIPHFRDILSGYLAKRPGPRP